MVVRLLVLVSLVVALVGCTGSKPETVRGLGARAESLNSADVTEAIFEPVASAAGRATVPKMELSQDEIKAWLAALSALKSAEDKPVSDAEGVKGARDVLTFRPKAGSPLVVEFEPGEVSDTYGQEVSELYREAIKKAFGG